MTVDGHKARLAYDDDIEMFRGEILGLAGGADFYGTSTKALRREFRISLDTYLQMCAENGVEPYRHYSGSQRVRMPPKERAHLAKWAQAEGISLNALAVKALRYYAELEGAAADSGDTD